MHSIIALLCMQLGIGDMCTAVLSPTLAVDTLSSIHTQNTGHAPALKSHSFEEQ